MGIVVSRANTVKLRAGDGGGFNYNPLISIPGQPIEFNAA